MAKLIKSPYSIKIDDAILSDVTMVKYIDGVLRIEAFATGYPLINALISKMSINKVFLVGVGTDEDGFNPGVTFDIKDYSVAILVDYKEPLKITLTFNVEKTNVGAITYESN